MKKNIVSRLLTMYKRFTTSPVAYAKSIGVQIDDTASLMDFPQWGSEPWLISIGANTTISSEVVFFTHDGSVGAARKYDSKYKNVQKFGRIDIGKCCFIGARTTILPDVIIGDNCVVGACSLVTKDVPSGEVWCGIPAKRLCSIEELSEKMLSETPEYDPNNLKINKQEETIIIADRRRNARRNNSKSN